MFSTDLFLSWKIWETDKLFWKVRKVKKCQKVIFSSPQEAKSSCKSPEKNVTIKVKSEKRNMILCGRNMFFFLSLSSVNHLETTVSPQVYSTTSCNIMKTQMNNIVRLPGVTCPQMGLVWPQHVSF